MWKRICSVGSGSVDVLDVLWARGVAEEVLGSPWLAWTSGWLMQGWRRGPAGRIFVGADRFCFIVDGGSPSPDRVFIFVFTDLGPVSGIFKRFAPRALVKFGSGPEFLGARKPMRGLH